MKIPIDIKEHKDEEKKRSEEIKERNMKYSQECSKARVLVLEFLKTNQDKAFTAEEIYNLFTWKYVNVEIIYNILEETIFSSKFEGLQILEPYDRTTSKIYKHIHSYSRDDRKSFHFFWKEPKSRNKQRNEKGFYCNEIKVAEPLISSNDMKNAYNNAKKEALRAEDAVKELERYNTKDVILKTYNQIISNKIEKQKELKKLKVSYLRDKALAKIYLIALFIGIFCFIQAILNFSGSFYLIFAIISGMIRQFIECNVNNDTSFTQKTIGFVFGFIAAPLYLLDFFKDIGILKNIKNNRGFQAVMFGKELEKINRELE